ncbi:MAG: bifunctional 5,10-methylenetetrahydrofolate dehydrogenase/5,10-methenyltetrahydrofolate cyclohydrolase [Bacteroidia bacterium]
MILLDGKKASEFFKAQIAAEVALLKQQQKKVPHLAAILVGNDGASETYVGSKVKTCEQIGFKSSLFRFESSVSEKEILEKIKSVNENDDIDGLIVQLPIPKHIASRKVTESILPAKDVDGFHPVNLGRLAQGQPCYIAATPKGILQLLEHYKIETEGKHCVIVGRSNIVGLPMNLLMSRNAYPGNCTVTVCHSKTKNIKAHTLQADILIAALGKPEFIKADMVKDGAVVIDVGITRVASSETKSGFKLTGDVKFDEVAPKCSYITPVPGGVGPMTIIGLLQNTLSAAKKEIIF